MLSMQVLLKASSDILGDSKLEVYLICRVEVFQHSVPWESNLECLSIIWLLRCRLTFPRDMEMLVWWLERMVLDSVSNGFNPCVRVMAAGLTVTSVQLQMSSTMMVSVEQRMLILWMHSSHQSARYSPRLSRVSSPKLVLREIKYGMQFCLKFWLSILQFSKILPLLLWGNLYSDNLVLYSAIEGTGFRVHLCSVQTMPYMD